MSRGDGQKLELQYISPVQGEIHVWVARYTVPMWLDSDVVIKMNIDTGEVLEFTTNWS